MTHFDYDKAPAQYLGVVWFPTCILRFVQRTNKDGAHVRILQQLWETRIMNPSGYAVYIQNPGQTEWRDIPLEVEEKCDD